MHPSRSRFTGPGTVALKAFTAFAALTAFIALPGCGAADSSAAPWAFAALALLLVGAAGIALGRRQGESRGAAALRANERHRSALLELQGGLVWQADEALRLHEISATGAALQRLDLAAWRGQPAAALWVEAAASSSQPSVAALLAARATIEARLVTLAGGGDEPLELSARPLTDDRGRFRGYVGALRASAKAKAAPTTDASDGAAARSAHDEALSFSYTLSHDLRAPVRVVEGFARILKEDYAQQLDRVGSDHLDRVLGAAARMNQMIDALLAMAQLAAQPLARQSVNLTQLAQFVVEDLRRGDPERQIDFDIAPALVAQGDPTLLRQVLENLLGNAWKYTQRSAQAHVRFVREQQDGADVYVVSDNGAGFDMRAVDRLFGLFQRLHSASDFPGTGVGLASVKRIVARHGGRIWAQAELGRGAAFYFTLRA